MSKELEALKRVVDEISNYKLHGIGEENWLGIQDVIKDIDIIEKGLEKLDRIMVLVDVRRFKTNDDELLREAIREVLDK